MTHGPACNTVAGRTSPFESKSCVMPTFLPRIPVSLAISFSIPSLARRFVSSNNEWRLLAEELLLFLCCVVTGFAASQRGEASLPHNLLMFLTECLNLNIHAGRQIELHQRIDRLLCRLENIEQALVGTDFKLLPRFLIDVRRTQHAVFVLHRGQRNRTGNLCAGAFRGLHDLACRLIQNAVVVGFQTDSNSFFSSHCVSLFAPPGSSSREERSGGKLQAANLNARVARAPVPAFTSAI